MYNAIPLQCNSIPNCAVSSYQDTKVIKSYIYPEEYDAMKKKKEKKRCASMSLSLQFHTRHLGHFQALSHTEIKHNLLASTRNSVGSDFTVQSLDLAALASTTVAQSSEDLTGLSGAVLKGNGALGLQAGDGTTETQHSLGLAHLGDLIDNAFQPGPGGLDLSGHVCELHADDGVIDELLAKGSSLVAVLDALLKADTGEAETLDNDTNTFVIEVGHDHCGIMSAIRNLH